MTDDDDGGLSPLPFDPAASVVESFIDLHEGEPWLLTNLGEYDAFALEAMREDGSGHQTLIAVQWPVRVNRSDEERVVQLLIHPEDVRGLLRVLTHTLTWLDEAKRMSG